MKEIIKGCKYVCESEGVSRKCKLVCQQSLLANARKITSQSWGVVCPELGMLCSEPLCVYMRT